jgi:hypothetical protein
MEKKNVSTYSSDMDYGFGFIQVQENEPFRNFMRKIDVDEENNKLSMTFSKLAPNPLIIDFNNKKLTLPSNQQKDFNKFFTVTFEYCKEKKAVIVKTFNYNKGKLDKGIKYLSLEEIKKVKLTNFLNIYSDNYFRISKKLIENDEKYIVPIPDFYKTFFYES